MHRFLKIAISFSMAALIVYTIWLLQEDVISVLTKNSHAHTVYRKLSQGKQGLKHSRHLPKPSELILTPGADNSRMYMPHKTLERKTLHRPPGSNELRYEEIKQRQNDLIKRKYEEARGSYNRVGIPIGTLKKTGSTGLDHNLGKPGVNKTMSDSMPLVGRPIIENNANLTKEVDRESEVEIVDKRTVNVSNQEVKINKNNQSLKKTTIRPQNVTTRIAMVRDSRNISVQPDQRTTTIHPIQKLQFNKTAIDSKYNGENISKDGFGYHEKPYKPRNDNDTQLKPGYDINKFRDQPKKDVDKPNTEFRAKDQTRLDFGNNRDILETDSRKQKVHGEQGIVQKDIKLQKSYNASSRKDYNIPIQKNEGIQTNDDHIKKISSQEDSPDGVRDAYQGKLKPFGETRKQQESQRIAGPERVEPKNNFNQQNQAGVRDTLYKAPREPFRGNANHQESQRIAGPERVEPKNNFNQQTQAGVKDTLYKAARKPFRGIVNQQESQRIAGPDRVEPKDNLNKQEGLSIRKNDNIIDNIRSPLNRQKNKEDGLQRFGHFPRQQVFGADGKSDGSPIRKNDNMKNAYDKARTASNRQDGPLRLGQLQNQPVPGAHGNSKQFNYGQKADLGVKSKLDPYSSRATIVSQKGGARKVYLNDQTHDNEIKRRQSYEGKINNKNEHNERYVPYQKDKTYKGLSDTPKLYRGMDNGERHISKKQDGMNKRRDQENGAYMRLGPGASHTGHIGQTQISEKSRINSPTGNGEARKDNNNIPRNGAL